MLDVVVSTNILTFLTLLVAISMVRKKTNSKILLLFGYSGKLDDKIRKKFDNFLLVFGIVLIVIVTPVWLYSILELYSLIF